MFERIAFLLLSAGFLLLSPASLAEPSKTAPANSKAAEPAKKSVVPAGKNPALTSKAQVSSSSASSKTSNSVSGKPAAALTGKSAGAAKPKSSISQSRTASVPSKSSKTTTRAAAKKTAAAKAALGTKTPSKAAKAVTQSVPRSVGADGKPIWLGVNQAQLAARAKRLPIIADVYTDWCHWCKVMDKKTFHDPEVEKYLAENFVCMKVNAEDGQEGQALAQRLQVSGFPTLVIFRFNGQSLGRIEGFRDPAQFLADIKQIQARSPR